MRSLSAAIPHPKNVSNFCHPTYTIAHKVLMHRKLEKKKKRKKNIHQAVLLIQVCKCLCCACVCVCRQCLPKRCVSACVFVRAEREGCAVGGNAQSSFHKLTGRRCHLDRCTFYQRARDECGQFGTMANIFGVPSVECMVPTPATYTHNAYPNTYALYCQSPLAPEDVMPNAEASQLWQPPPPRKLNARAHLQTHTHTHSLFVRTDRAHMQIHSQNMCNGAHAFTPAAYHVTTYQHNVHMYIHIYYFI